MEDVLLFVFDFFMERHIALKEKWLSEVLSLLPSFLQIEKQDVYSAENRDNIASLMYEQWKYTDISETTYPLLKQLGLCLDVRKTCLTQPLVLQICSVVDIGSSFYSQFCALVHEFVDNTGFEPLPDMEHGHGLDDLESKPRRMLSLTVSDGETILRAIEYHSIKSFSLLTKPGCKKRGITACRISNKFFQILLIPPVLYRNGVFLLSSRNVQLLGGDVESVFKDGRPLQMMSRKLNLAIPTSKMKSHGVQKNSVQVDICGNDLVGKLHRDDEINGLSVHSNMYDQKRDNPENNDITKLKSYATEMDKVADEHITECSRNRCELQKSILSAGTTPRTTQISSAPTVILKPVAQISPIYTDGRNPESPSRLEDSPPDFDAARSYTHTTSKSPFLVAFPKMVAGFKNVVCVEELKERVGIQSYLRPGSFRKSVQSGSDEIKLDVIPKKIKVEVIELDDEEDIKPNELSSLTLSSTISSPSTSGVLKTVKNNPEDAVVVKFLALNVVLITDALKQMRFVVGSSRKTIQGIVVDIVKPLRIVDNMWTMKVTIEDDSTDNFICVIDNLTLSTLIGLTPQEAIEIRASHDVCRREDGQRRLAAVEEQLKRLDLLMDVEFFSGGRTDPVIRCIRTLMQALELIN
ncbi:hypothetical protein DICVIV_05425 [Dictyocaulus viviparus]|uniref:RecQ-mediated genome instability protein 1 n=1 Tax=Dictyocaulus viviparus TaxID=29172 RepID=A0A0D8XVB4_DICVI|nr:hypothetical protein DICVIV_05425 [Dictyocaulus viviparus]